MSSSGIGYKTGVAALLSVLKWTTDRRSEETSPCRKFRIDENLAPPVATTRAKNWLTRLNFVSKNFK